MNETVAVRPCDEEGAEMTDILKSGEQLRLHEENQEALRAVMGRLDQLIDKQSRVETALAHGFGIDINDPKTIRKFAEEHSELLDQRSSLVNLQLRIGKIMLWVTAGVVTYLATKIAESEWLQFFIGGGHR